MTFVGALLSTNGISKHDKITKSMRLNRGGGSNIMGINSWLKQRNAGESSYRTHDVSDEINIAECC